jgi:hypothetical protein
LAFQVIRYTIATRGKTKGVSQGHSGIFGIEKIDRGAISPREWSISTLGFTPTAGYSLAGWFPQADDISR